MASNSGVSGKPHVNGSPAPGRKPLKAEFEVLLTKAATKFDKYPDLFFDDPARLFYGSDEPVFGTTDENGDAMVSGNIDVNGQPAGMLNAVFRERYLKKAATLVSTASACHSIRMSYTGIRLPEGDKARVCCSRILPTV